MAPSQDTGKTRHAAEISTNSDIPYRGRLTPQDRTTSDRTHLISTSCGGIEQIIAWQSPDVTFQPNHAVATEALFSPTHAITTREWSSILWCKHAS